MCTLSIFAKIVQKIQSNVFVDPLGLSVSMEGSLTAPWVGPPPADAEFSDTWSDQYFPADEDYSDVWSGYDLLNPSQNKDLELPNSAEGKLHRYLICNRRVPGFVLTSRTWCKPTLQRFHETFWYHLKLKLTSRIL